MDLRYSREATVGTIVIVAIAVFVIGMMWLSGRSFTGCNTVTVQFANAAGLKDAAPVRISGYTVGKVRNVHLVEPGRVLADLCLPDRIRPKIDASAQIVSISLVGDYAVDFKPGTAPQPLPEGRVIIGTQEAGFTGLAEKLGARADTVLGNLQELTNAESTQQLKQTLQSTQELMATLARTLPATAAEANRTMAALRATGAQLDRTLSNPSLQRALDRSDSLAANLQAMTARLGATSARLDSVLALVQNGRGTLGKMATDSTLYRNLVGLTASMDSLMVELRRHPGKLNINPSVKIF